MSGSGRTIVAAGATLDMTFNGNRFLSRVLDNSGTATYGGSGILIFNGGTFNNLAGGVFNATIVTGNGLASGGGTNAFNNAGTFNRTGNALGFSVDVPFNNTGTLNL